MALYSWKFSSSFLLILEIGKNWWWWEGCVRFTVSCCYCFLAALIVQASCSAAQHSPAGPLLVLALPPGTGGATIHHCSSQEERGKEVWWQKGVLRSVTLGCRGYKGLNVAFVTGAHPSSPSQDFSSPWSSMKCLCLLTAAMPCKGGRVGWVLEPILQHPDHLLPECPRHFAVALPQFSTSSLQCSPGEGRAVFSFWFLSLQWAEAGNSSFHGLMVVIRATDLTVLWFRNKEICCYF